jgi:hypothetical protein
MEARLGDIQSAKGVFPGGERFLAGLGDLGLEQGNGYVVFLLVIPCQLNIKVLARAIATQIIPGVTGQEHGPDMLAKLTLGLRVAASARRLDEIRLPRQGNVIDHATAHGRPDFRGAALKNPHLAGEVIGIAPLADIRREIPGKNSR